MVIKTVFLVPVRDNEGRRFQPLAWRALKQRLISDFGGYTLTHGVQGAWRDEGLVYEDLNRQYTVVLSSWGQLAAWLRTVSWVRETFRQEAIYIEVEGHPEIWRGDP
jgi:hypothetical protein